AARDKRTVGLGGRRGGGQQRKYACGNGSNRQGPEHRVSPSVDVYFYRKLRKMSQTNAALLRAGTTEPYAANTRKSCPGTVTAGPMCYDQGSSAAALRPEMRPKARHSPIFPVPWYKWL